MPQMLTRRVRSLQVTDVSHNRQNDSYGLARMLRLLHHDHTILGSQKRPTGRLIHAQLLGCCSAAQPLLALVSDFHAQKKAWCCLHTNVLICI